MHEKMANYFKVLSDPMRIEIIELLLKGETCGCTLIDKLPISQPTLSYHLKVLQQVGLTESTREGNKVLYTVNKAWLSALIEMIETLKNTTLEACEF